MLKENDSEMLYESKQTGPQSGMTAGLPGHGMVTLQRRPPGRR